MKNLLLPLLVLVLVGGCEKYPRRELVHHESNKTNVAPKVKAVKRLTHRAMEKLWADWSQRKKESAQRWLALLRNAVGTDSENVDGRVRYLREEVEKGGLTLADIGTSEDELIQLRIKGCEVGAREWLRLLRDNPCPDSSAIPDCTNRRVGYLRKEVREGGLTLSDIGTNEEEISSFTQ